MQDSGSPALRRRSQLSRLERSVNACQRCRRRKQKCDLQYPRCSSCVRIASPCLIFDSSKGTEIPRDYIQTLETETARLKAEVQMLRQQELLTDGFDQSHVGGNRAGSEELQNALPNRNENDRDIVMSMARVALGSTNEPRFMGTSSGITLAKLVLAAIDLPLSNNEPDAFMEDPLSLFAAPSSLPPRRAAIHLLDVYFQHRSPYFVFLSRQNAQQSIDHVYEVSANDPQYDKDTMDHHLFVVYAVLAIALSSGLKSHSASAQQSEGCFNSALRYVDSVFAYRKGDLETLSCVLLLAQYLSICPTRGSLWQITGVALRLCIDLGLHWESSSLVTKDSRLLDQRRSLFWTTYKVDRLLSITLGRPLTIIDTSINVALPDVKPDAVADNEDVDRIPLDSGCLTKRKSNHLIIIYQLESEIKHVLYHQFRSPSLAFPRPDYPLWFPDISRRLEQWFADIPIDSHAFGSGDQAWWTALHSNALLLLHRPCPIIPQPPSSSLIVCSNAARSQILSIRDIYREGKIDIVWIWVHRLFLAGLTTVYCLSHSAEVRRQISLEELMETMQACSGVLSALAERFPGAAGCRDSFEKLAAATTLKYVKIQNSCDVNQSQPPFSSQNAAPHMNWNASPCRNRSMQFAGKEPYYSHGLRGINPTPDMESIFRQLFYPLDEIDLDSMFPYDDLALGESLSSAAQWPNNSFPDFFGGQ